MTYPHTALVVDLFVRCSYPMRPDAIAASDTCQQPADSAVEVENGNLFWRCPDHQGMRRPGAQGRVVFEVVVRPS